MKLISLGLAAMAALTATSAVMAQTYRLIDLGTLPGGGPSQALALSSSGVVVGSGNLSNGGFHAVQFGRVNKDLGALSGGLSQALGIGSTGAAVGYSYVGTGSPVYHAVVFSGGSVTDLGVLPGGVFSQAVGLNALGQVVGNGDVPGGANRGWVYQMGHATPLQTLGTLGGQNSAAAAISDAGVVVGSANLAGPYASGGPQHAVSWVNGVPTDLGTLAPSNPDATSSATAISSTGLIAGSAISGDGRVHAFLHANGTMTDLGLLPNTTMTAATGVNASGVVVGAANVPRLDYRGRPVAGKGTLIAFVYRDGVMANLTTLVPSGWTINRVTAINDAGQIAGTATGPGGIQHAVLLSP
jgi:probable HAF family extracellular repeat protein